MLKIFKTYRGLPRSIYILFIAQIINRFGDFVVPFLTLYLTQKIGLSAGISGVIVTANILIGIPASLLGGKAADSLGRRKTYLWSQSIATISLWTGVFRTGNYGIRIKGIEYHKQEVM
jgi:MFS family permease